MARPLRPDLRVRTAIRVFGVLAKLGVLPTDIGALPLARRQAMRPPRFLQRRPPSGLDIVDREVSGRDGAVSVRVYRVTHAAEPQPVVAYFHGGGWVSGGPDDSHYLCAQLAWEAGMTVVSVAYRLSPEHPFPAALHDCYDAVCWLAENGADLGTDPGRIAVAGDSAGGNLAAATCLLARRLGRPRIAFQALLYPSLDATLSTPAMASFTGPGLTREMVDTVVAHYVGGAERSDELVSPLLVDDVSGLPPALVVTADLDILRDDGRLYAERLAAAGVPVRYTNYLGTLHGFFSNPRLARAEPQARSELVQQLIAALGPKPNLDGPAVSGR